jgi:hypothetical protein
VVEFESLTKSEHKSYRIIHHVDLKVVFIERHHNYEVTK